MSKHILNASLLAAGLFFTAMTAQATELSARQPLAADVLLSVEQVLISQSKAMLQSAVLDLKLELEAELSAQWQALTGSAEQATTDTEQKVDNIEE